MNELEISTTQDCGEYCKDLYDHTPSKGELKTFRRLGLAEANSKQETVCLNCQLLTNLISQAETGRVKKNNTLIANAAGIGERSGCPVFAAMNLAVIVTVFKTVYKFQSENLRPTYSNQNVDRMMYGDGQFND